MYAVMATLHEEKYVTLVYKMNKYATYVVTS